MKIYEFKSINYEYEFGNDRDKRLLKKVYFRVNGFYQDQIICPFCRTNLITFYSDMAHPTVYHFKVCVTCKWWRFKILFQHLFEWIDHSMTMNNFEFDNSNIFKEDVPIGILRKYLLQHWNDKKEISPQKAEELVASIFKEHLNGEVFYLTNSVYAKDGGIDFVIIKKDNSIPYAFQIKRRQTERPECVRSVREFIGSIAQSNFAYGYFVTTADYFSKDLINENLASQNNLLNRKINLSLIDGRQLFDLLKQSEIKTNGFYHLKSTMTRECNDITDWKVILNNSTINYSKEELFNTIIIE